MHLAISNPLRSPPEAISGRFGSAWRHSARASAVESPQSVNSAASVAPVAIVRAEFFHLRPGGPSRAGHVDRGHAGRRQSASCLCANSPPHFFHDHRDCEPVANGFDLFQQSPKARVAFRLQRFLQRVEVEDQPVGFRQLDRPAAMVHGVTVIQLHRAKVGKQQDIRRNTAHAKGGGQRRGFEGGTHRPERHGNPGGLRGFGQRPVDRSGFLCAARHGGNQNWRSQPLPENLGLRINILQIDFRQRLVGEMEPLQSVG